MVKRIASGILAALTCFCTHAETPDTRTGVFAENIKTLQVQCPTDPATTGTPTLVLDRGDVATISFDILGDDRDYLRYELIHCNARWEPSDLNALEYVGGFNEGTVDNYEFSRATSVHYVHYTLTIPSPDMPILRSGNYLVRIYDENDPENTLLQARICLSEQTAFPAVAVSGRTDVDYNRGHQQLEIHVDCRDSGVRDLFNDLTIVVEQNGREDNVVVLDHPARVVGNTVVYEHRKPLIFEAGNEYRRFETVANTWNGMNVDRVEWHAPYYNHYLIPDVPRADLGYLYDRTLRGGFLVREYNATNSDTEADYVVVHFSLDMAELGGYDIFIDSDATLRHFDPESRMVYNRATGRYERSLLLKQGAYSYQYLAVPRGSDRGLNAPIEGDKYQTDNQYTVSIYTRAPGERADRLIGRATIFAQQ